jgi:hypothetical protein
MKVKIKNIFEIHKKASFGIIIKLSERHIFY